MSSRERVEVRVDGAFFFVFRFSRRKFHASHSRCDQFVHSEGVCHRYSTRFCGMKALKEAAETYQRRG